MDTSYVAVGTTMCMITDSLTYSSQEKHRRSGAPVPLLCPGDPCAPARASRPCRDVGRRGRLYRWPATMNKSAATAILHGLARRTAPQTQPPRIGSRSSRWPAEESPAGGANCYGTA